MRWIASSVDEIFQLDEIQIAFVLQLFIQQLDLLLVLPRLSVHIIASLFEQVLVFANTFFLLYNSSLDEERNASDGSQAPIMIDTT